MCDVRWYLRAPGVRPLAQHRSDPLPEAVRDRGGRQEPLLWRALECAGEAMADDRGRGVCDWIAEVLREGGAVASCKPYVVTTTDTNLLVGCTMVIVHH